MNKTSISPNFQKAVEYATEYCYNKIAHVRSFSFSDLLFIKKLETIEDEIKSWYQHTDITDPYELAAAALWFGEYKVPRDYKKSYDEVLIAKKILLEMEKNI